MNEAAVASAVAEEEEDKDEMPKPIIYISEQQQQQQGSKTHIYRWSYLIIFVETIIHKSGDNGRFTDSLISQEYKFVLSQWRDVGAGCG